jgi:hypothetical protein
MKIVFAMIVKQVKYYKIDRGSCDDTLIRGWTPGHRTTK